MQEFEDQYKCFKCLGGPPSTSEKVISVLLCTSTKVLDMNPSLTLFLKRASTRRQKMTIPRDCLLPSPSPLLIMLCFTALLFSVNS